MIDIQYWQTPLLHRPTLLLLEYFVDSLLHIFQYSNVYAITPHIRYLADSPSMQAACIACVTVPGAPPPSFSKIFALYPVTYRSGFVICAIELHEVPITMPVVLE